MSSTVGFTLAIDLTGSMGTRDCPGGLTRTVYAHACVQTMLVALREHDVQAIDVIGFGADALLWPTVPLGEVMTRLGMMPPRETVTRTDLALATAWYRHLTCGHARSAVIVITDGPPALVYGMDLILNEILTRCEPPHEFAIELLSVGRRSAALELYFKVLGELEPEIDIVTAGALNGGTLAELVRHHCCNA